MTVLNYPQLIASFPDNSDGQITPENMRDFVDSVERKYDDWNIVKAGNIEGNKFPDPVGGEIILPSNSIWVINGQIPVTDTIVFEDGAALISLTGAVSQDAVILDASAGAIPLFRAKNGDNASLLISGLTLQVDSLTGTLFDFDNTNAVTIENCIWGAQTLGNWTDGTFVEIINVGVFLASSSALQINGTFTTVRFDRTANAGFGILGTNGDIFDMSGATISSLSISQCESQVAQASSALFRVAGDATAAVATVNDSRLFSGVAGDFILGVDNKSITFTFDGNSGFKNTMATGGLVVTNNGVVTPNAGAGVWVIPFGTSVDFSGNSRFSSVANAAGEINGLQYDGNDLFDGSLHLSGTFLKTGGGVDLYQISIFKNGALYVNNGVNYFQEDEAANGTYGNLAMIIPLENIAQNDKFDFVMTFPASAADTLTLTQFQMEVK